MALRAELSESQASSLAFLFDQTDEVPLGSVTVELDGVIRRSDPPMPLDFGFTFAGRPFIGKALSTSQGVRIDLDTLIGLVPYSVEDAFRRNRIARLMASLADSPVCAKVGKDQSIRLGLSISIPSAPTPVLLITAIVECLLDAQPYFDLVAEVVGTPERSH
ncbi:MAG TPA: hypothetical protein VNT30_21165 [Stellaceae bacterium]|nr:hypothetical protein [Stellaceae bacterium]